MTFLVTNSEGKGMFCTEYVECVPDKATRDSMKSAGYKLYLDGKVFKDKEWKEKYGK